MFVHKAKIYQIFQYALHLYYHANDREIEPNIFTINECTEKKMSTPCFLKPLPSLLIRAAPIHMFMAETQSYIIEYKPFWPGRIQKINLETSFANAIKMASLLSKSSQIQGQQMQQRY